MYTFLWRCMMPVMRRIQIYLDEDVDDALTVEAARLGTSKAALIRESLAGRTQGAGADHDAARERIVGWIKEELPESDSIDDVIYRR